MRTALILLFLLALAAVPGSIIPQRDVDAIAVSRWQDAHPGPTPVYDALGLFSVYDSVWFSAIYILLMVSLVGCILPRTRIYWQAMRARPPRRRGTCPGCRSPGRSPSMTSPRPCSTGPGVLRRRRYRVDASTDEVAAERGYLREAGNLLFHVSLLVVLVGFALGGLYGYTGGVIVVKGQGSPTR